jgi:hypothetical protein
MATCAVEYLVTHEPGGGFRFISWITIALGAIRRSSAGRPATQLVQLNRCRCLGLRCRTG